MKNDDEFFELKQENVISFLEEIIKAPHAPDLFKESEVEEVLKYFNDANIRKLAGIIYSKNQDTYIFNSAAISKFVDIVVDKSLSSGLQELIRDGFVDVLWDDELNDFVYKKSDKFYGTTGSDSGTVEGSGG